jgi:hypothetical protein
MAKPPVKPTTAVKSGADRPNGKAFKKAPKVFDPIKRRLVRKAR